MDIQDVNKSKRSLSSWGFETMLTTPISSYCLVDMADWQLRKSAFISTVERDVTLDIVGNSVTGIANKVSDEIYRYNYSYTEGNNYINDFQKDASSSTTREGYTNNTFQNYNNHNQLYGESFNVYPDEDNTGTDKFTDDRKWNYYEGNKNRNSIIRKTKELFNNKKINTIISRFHTDPDNLDLYNGTEAKSDYGLSHGRNLLTYDAERNGISYDRNGYDNPYCRVWTHHHQYSEYRTRLIRPFTVEGESGEDVGMTSEEFHNWPNFVDMGEKNFIDVRSDSVENKGPDNAVYYKDNHGNISSELDEVQVARKETRWSWKDSGSDGWAKSVLNRDTGLVNIAPKFLGGAEMNVHPKDCMFSIENLAWQGYNPYSFEKALSWEQRGPFGGRIMWFPPYGLTFSEETSANWSEHTFIGRGESVFTYTNTVRSGTLNFMMVVDHPSILDYSTWYGESQPDKLPKDTDVLRFFAGCDVGSGSGTGETSNLSSYARPTPLTDEYLLKSTPGAIDVVDNLKKKDELNSIKPSSDEEITLTFYVFFPNNYSGAYDNRDTSVVDPIAYLLCGKGAQWRCNPNDVTQSESLLIEFKDISKSAFLGNGYEMKNSGTYAAQDTENNYVLGTYHWNSGTYKTNKSKYIPYPANKWYYRVDGQYKVASGGEVNHNTFDQKLDHADGQKDIASKNLGLNYSIDAVKKQFTEEKDNENLYSLAEVAYVLLNNYDSETENENQATINARTGNVLSKTDARIKTLLELFDKRENSIYKVVEINGIGYSNSHGYKEKNKYLAQQRCNTVISWFKRFYGNSEIKTGSTTSEPSVPVQPQDVKDESGPSAKKWRSAKITIKLTKTVVETPQELNQEPSKEKFLTPQEYESLSSEEKSKCKVVKYSFDFEKDGCTNFTFGTDITKEEYDKNVAERPDFPRNCYIPSEYSINVNDLTTEIEPPKFQRFDGFSEVEIDMETNTQLYVNDNETNAELKECRWYYDEESGQMRTFIRDGEKKKRSSYNWKTQYGKDYENTDENNSLRYDQEYHFFKQLKKRDPMVFDSLVKKLQYFDPAFHSMTPEGFMGRLNFLHQCTRQGNTNSASDATGYSANNLAFGRPPFCVLRLGDFYYQKIVIRNISINYDPLVLDLNTEGIGVVPLIANVTISFNFIGGGDLTGPVRRLQNAMSFNYYANGRLYDNRSDRVEREKTNWETMGAMGHDKVQFDKSLFFKPSNAFF